MTDKVKFRNSNHQKFALAILMAMILLDLALFKMLPFYHDFCNLNTVTRSEKEQRSFALHDNNTICQVFNKHCQVCSCAE